MASICPVFGSIATNAPENHFRLNREKKRVILYHNIGRLIQAIE
jgi:hypothetical protein